MELMKQIAELVVIAIDVVWFGTVVADVAGLRLEVWIGPAAVLIVAQIPVDVFECFVPPSVRLVTSVRFLVCTVISLFGPADI